MSNIFDTISSTDYPRQGICNVSPSHSTNKATRFQCRNFCADNGKRFYAYNGNTGDCRCYAADTYCPEQFRLETSGLDYVTSRVETMGNSPNIYVPMYIRFVIIYI